ncbi:MAG: hypothetical protein E7L01_25170 [Paenibacillus macerans]|uniref:Uncharacterized protein n=1 Tax=Paenibacillus macerans TaxID=44252 RepID=A0A090YSF4_PAEMA|nr:hypothetical protein [Paenibacillus macerans]KFN00898.1 hypothetical protein DJ90_4533 [Paenibacillus macerans]MBS5911901.1 hypothetical protein [Paenibacillus macerans]MCY7561920.1 hypothetical protein [Paenibacillus macerans]MDU5949085.1 hypothetical protein [Paenibacillus macerans]MDU7476606.1 hypothetical protein [Paenibacillus macerans]
MAPNHDKTKADFVYERYELLAEDRPENDIPDDDLLHHDTRVAQGISENTGEDGQNDIDSLPDLLFGELTDVPDADAIQKDSPVDPVAPDPDAMHGTDLLNGYDGDED